MSLTDDECRRGFRIDEETAEKLRPGVLTSKELREHLEAMGRFWRRELGDPDRRPEIEGAWVWDDWHGWLRVKEGKAK